MPQQPTKKRKVCPGSNTMTLLQRLHSACDFLSDEGQLELLLTFCERATTVSTSEHPKWVKSSGSFLSTLSIIPKEWDPHFDFPIDKLEAIAIWCNQDDSWEKLGNLKKLIGECFPQNNLTERSVMQLLSAIQRIVEMFTEIDLGELVASAGITTLLGVLKSVFPDVTMNGDKQSVVSLSDELPPLHVRNDGYLATKQKGYTFLLREDKSLDKHVDWCTPGTDCYKLIICMKSALRNNMQHFSFTKEQMIKYSKVIGLSYLKSVAYLFILEASFTETQTEIIPTYSLCFKEYSMQEDSEVLKLWLDIAFFIENHAPRKSSFTAKPYRPTDETPLKNLKLLGDVMLSTKTDKRIIRAKEGLKKFKPIISSVKNHDDVLIVRNTSVIKEVGDEERRIILKLANRDEYSLYLPTILNIYACDVEFEHLHPLPSQLDDDFLLMMACDISIALRYLHDNNIVHRDVKPSNTMIRSFNNPSTYMWFVLIDFGLSFEMVKEQGACYKLSSTGEKVLVHENVGTGLFQAPEVRATQNYDEKIDIYSLGASLLYLKNKTLYETIYGRDEDLQIGLRSLVWENIGFGEKVLQMVDSDPKKRPSAHELEEVFSTLYNSKQTPGTSETSDNKEFLDLLA